MKSILWMTVEWIFVGFSSLMCRIGLGHSWDDNPQRTFEKCVWCGRVRKKRADAQRQTNSTAK